MEAELWKILYLDRFDRSDRATGFSVAIGCCTCRCELQVQSLGIPQKQSARRRKLMTVSTSDMSPMQPFVQVGCVVDLARYAADVRAMISYYHCRHTMAEIAIVPPESR